MSDEDISTPTPSGEPAAPQPARTVAELLPDTVAWEYRAVPLAWQQEQLLVGMVEPEADANAHQALQSVTGVPLVIVGMPEENFERMFAAAYPQSVFVARHLRPAAAAPPSTAAQLSQFWHDSPFSEWAGMLGSLFAAAFVLAIMMLIGYFAIGGIMAGLRLLLNPAVIGLLLLGVAAFVYWRSSRQQAPPA